MGFGVGVYFTLRSALDEMLCKVSPGDEVGFSDGAGDGGVESMIVHWVEEGVVECAAYEGVGEGVIP